MVALTRKTGSHPYLKMARIVEASLFTNEERLEDRIVERTKWLGANAVILGKVSSTPWSRGHCMNLRSPSRCRIQLIFVGAVGMVGSLASRFLELRPRGCESKERQTISVRRYESVRAVRTDGD